MKYAILINSNPDTSASAISAYRFAQAALDAGHDILRVFFYQEGIYHALRYRTAPDDECNLTQAWQTLAQAFELDLVVCVSAAQRRGLLNPDEAKRQGKQDDDLAAGFRIGGLGQWLEAMLAADRVIEF